MAEVLEQALDKLIRSVVASKSSPGIAAKSCHGAEEIDTDQD